MTRLEHLRALLDEALRGDPKASDEFLGLYGEPLLEVAEAVRYHLEDACGDCAIRFCEDDSDIGCSLDDMRAALAPLVKETDDE